MNKRINLLKENTEEYKEISNDIIRIKSEIELHKEENKIIKNELSKLKLTDKKYFYLNLFLSFVLVIIPLSFLSIIIYQKFWLNFLTSLFCAVIQFGVFCLTNYVFMMIKIHRKLLKYGTQFNLKKLIFSFEYPIDKFFTYGIKSFFSNTTIFLIMLF